MKKIIYILISVIFLLNLTMPTSNANEEETLEEQQEEFGISEFIEQAKEYSGEFFEDIDMNEILENAIKGEVDNQTIFKKIVSLLGGELVDGLTILGSKIIIISMSIPIISSLLEIILQILP